MKLRNRAAVASLVVALLAGGIFVLSKFVDKRIEIAETEYSKVQASMCIQRYAADVLYRRQKVTGDFPASQGDFDRVIMDHADDIRCGIHYSFIAGGHVVDSFGDRLIYKVYEGGPLIASRNTAFNGSSVFFVMTVIKRGPIHVELNCKSDPLRADFIGKIDKQLCEVLSARL